MSDNNFYWYNNSLKSAVDSMAKYNRIILDNFKISNMVNIRISEVLSSNLKVREQIIR